MQYDVFISYSRKDYVDDKKNIIPDNVVSKIKESLSDAGITYWFDEEGINYGDNFVDKIVSNIEKSHIFLFLATENSNKSRWTCKEIASADELGKYIIPVRIDNTPYNKQVLFRIADISYIDYFNNPEKGVEDLINSIKSYLNQLQEEAKRKAEEEQRKLEIEKNKKEEEKNKKKQEKLINTIKLSCSTLNNQEEKLEIDRKNLLLQTDEITDANLRDSLRQLILDGGCIHQKYQKELKYSNEDLARKEVEINQKDVLIDNQNEEILKLKKKITQLSQQSQNIQQVEERLKQFEQEALQKDDAISEQKKEICKITKEKEQILQQKRSIENIVNGLKKQLNSVTTSREELEKISADYCTRYYEVYNDLKAKEKYIDAIKYATIPLIITDIEIADKETDYGETIYSSSATFLYPRIKYIGLSSGSKEFKIKWYKPDGSLLNSVPLDYSYSNECSIAKGQNTLTLSGWGYENKGNWGKGAYRIEIWYEDYILGSKFITIY